MTTAFLTLPAPEDRSFPRLQRKLRLLAAHRLLHRPPAGLPRGWAALQRAVAEGLRARPEETLAAVGAVDVLPFALLDGDPALLAPNLLAALAPLPEALLWEAPVRRVVAPRLGLAIRFDPPAKAMAADPAGISFSLASGQVWRPGEPPPPGAQVDRPFHALHPDLPGLRLAEVDSNPLAYLEDHPDKSGNAIDLGGRAAADWRAALREALDVVAFGLPEWWAELPGALERVVPVGFDAHRHLSASYREVPGLAYLSLHPDPLTMAEAIIHETQHGKLNTLLGLDPVLRNGQSTWTASPVRPDMRPLNGVLLAVHAFAPVAALHARLAERGHPLAQAPRFAERRREVRAGNEQGLAVLREKAEPTPVGERLLAALEAVHASVG